MQTQIFEDHAAELHWLAYLLTGSHDRSVRALTNALDADDMLSWSRELVIAESLDTIRPELGESARRTAHAENPDPSALAALRPIGSQQMTTSELERALLTIDLFRRCALLLTVFEKLSLEDAALLLNADKTLVRKAQSQGLLDLARAVGDREPPPARYTFRLRVRCVEMLT